MMEGAPCDRPDGAYWGKSKTFWVVVKDRRIVAIVRLWAGPLLYRATRAPGAR